jgi:hypothetical protein
MSGIGPRMQAATWSTLGQYSSTDIDAYSQPNAHGTGTDIYYHWSPLPAGTIGRYECVLYGSGFRCTHAHAQFDDNQIGGYTDDQLKRLACHETGHATGLLHGQDGDPVIPNNNAALACMCTPLIGGSHLDGHNVAHLNYHY